MAVKHLGRGSNLAATGVAPAANIALLGKVIAYAYGKGKELVTFKPGNQTVVTRYEGDSNGFIEVETSDMSVWAAHSVGEKFTAVTLTMEAAADSAGTADGDSATMTMSHAALTSLTDPQADNASKKPVTFRMRFDLDQHVGASTPTMTGPTAV